MDKIIAKQTAKKKFVIDAINEGLTKSFLYTNQNLNGLESVLTDHIEALENILITKLNITEDDIKQSREFISERNKKDNIIIDKYFSDDTKSTNDKLFLMKEDGLSNRTYDKVKYALEKREIQMKPRPQQSISGQSQLNLTPQTSEVKDPEITKE